MLFISKSKIAASFPGGGIYDKRVYDSDTFGAYRYTVIMPPTNQIYTYLNSYADIFFSKVVF
ncbi:MAG: hypothetical protein IJ366_02420, partial [Clostridia bacterium]|nr:hypothetical protein [Clostridia bacterium]